MSGRYVHGYQARETARLRDQATTLEELLHGGTAFPPGSRVLEVGCGVGAQTVALARRSPQAHFTSIDLSRESLSEARQRVRAAGFTNVEFREADIFAAPFPALSFDHVFVCFVLEHLACPAEALAALRDLLRPGGTLTAIEGDHGSAYFFPESAPAQAVIDCQIALQRAAGGNSLIGRQLYPLMRASGFADVVVVPKMVYVDSARPELVEGFTRRTFTAMIEGIREPAIAGGLIEAAEFDAGIRGLHRTCQHDGVFCYTFFKGAARRL